MRSDGTTQQEVTFATLKRLRLKAAGFDPLPDDGKECFLVAWTSKTNVSDDEIISWQSLAASTNTGILCKFTPAFDLDILNPAAAEAVEEYIRQQLGIEPLVRTGLPPKRLIPLRTDKPFSKIPIKFIDTKEKLEFLGDGQQFVAFGIHPNTKQPYTWRGGEPGSVLRSGLPLIDEQSARSLINAAADLLVERFGYRRVENKREPTTCGVHLPRHSASDWTQALRLMNPIDWNGDNDGWFKLMTACKAAGIARTDFITWSIGDPDYKDDAEETGRRWDSVKPMARNGKAEHDGALRAALIARGIQPPRPAGYGTTRGGHPLARARTINWWSRLNSVLDRLQAKQDPDMLFWAGCRVAEIIADTGKPRPSVAVELLAGRVHPVIGRDEAQRVIGNAFSVVERQILEGDAA